MSPVVPMRLPLESFTVERFRGIRGLELRDLGRFNLLVGRNNSGKTSVLEALSIFSAPLDPWNWLGTAMQREPFGQPTWVEWLRCMFPQTTEVDFNAPYDGKVHLWGEGRTPVVEVTAHYQSVRGTKGVSEWSGYENRPVMERPIDRSTERNGARLDASVKTRQLDLFPEGEASGSFTIWVDNPFIGVPRRVEPTFACRSIKPADHWHRPIRDVSEAKAGGHWDATVALLKKIEPAITDAELLVPPWASESSPAVYLRDARAGLLPLSSFGDGVRRALLFALTIPSVAGGVLLIDELETAIHVSALEHIFRWLLDACVTHDVQVFATTHSLEALDAILAVDLTPEEDIVAYRLEREGEQTTARRYGEDLLKRIRYERGLDVR